MYQLSTSTKSSVMLCLRSLFLLSLAYANASPIAAPACYDDLIDLPAPEALDCASGMINLKNDPFYSKPQTYGILEAPPRNVPIDWTHGSCMMSVTAIDASKTDTFPLSQTMAAFAAIYEICIRKKKTGQGFGGSMPIGHGKTFYAVVQYNPNYPSVAFDEHLVGSSTGTGNATALQLPHSSGSAATS